MILSISFHIFLAAAVDHFRNSPYGARSLWTLPSAAHLLIQRHDQLSLSVAY